MTKAIRWGLVGASDIAATRVAPAMRAAGHKVVGVCSAANGHAANWARTNKVDFATDNLDHLLDAVDAVYISSRNDKHAAQALTAIAAGKHVLLEKPLATTLADATRVVEAADEAGVTLAVNHHLPQAGTHRKVRELVSAGLIGRPLAVSVRHAVLLPERLRGWRLGGEPGAGVILDITVHDASVLNPLLGGPASRVSAVATSQGPWSAESEDAAMVSLEYRGNVLAQTHDSFTSAHTPTRLEVHGDEGTITALDVMTQDPDGRVLLTTDLGVKEVDVTDRRDLYLVTIEAMADAVAGVGRPAVTGREGLAAYAVGQAALDAANSGRTITLEH